MNNSHWVTIASSSPTTVQFYDSLYPLMSSHAALQIAAITSCSESTIKIIQYKTQFQKGGSDCGLFAIAYALDLCLGTEPAGIRYDQSQLRPHLLKCLSNECLTPFPSTTCKEVVLKEGSIDVFCTCRLPEVESEKMAQCDSCNEWFIKVAWKCRNMCS